MKRVLFIAHNFPPIGGAGVQRSLKFVKHLPALGFLPTVLTGSGPSKGRWTPRDESLLREIPSDVSVVRAARDAGKDQRLRQQALVATGETILRGEPHDLILVSMSPFADAWCAAALAARRGLLWVADLRDPWALDEFQVYRSGLHRIRERWRMRTALESAALIIMNTPESARRFKWQFPEIKCRVVSITNGYDADDFCSPICGQRESDKFTIVHSGYFHTDVGLHQKQRALEYRLLGRTEPGVKILARSHYYLVKALERWQESRPEIRTRVRVCCIGTMTSADREVVERSSVSGLFEFTEYLSHKECLKVVRQADLLFLPLHQMPEGRRASIVPGKTYEYMATGIPILAAVPEGDAKDFLRHAGIGLVCEPDDVEAMLRRVKTQFEAWNQRQANVEWNKSYVERFERRKLTECLANELESTVLTASR